MADQTPRVNVPLLSRFTNRNVRIVGKVVSIRGDIGVLESSGTATIHLDKNTNCVMNHYAEIIGKVNPDLSIKALASSDWGADLDMTSVDAVVDVTHRYKELFYDE